MAKQKTTDEVDDAADLEVAPRFSRGLLIGAGGVGTLVVAGLIYFLTSDPTPEPEVLFQDSLGLLDRGDVRRAGNVARYLEELKYRDLEFGGGVQFVLGVSEFELGSNYSVDDHTSTGHYEKAVEHLQAAFDEGLVLSRRSRWAYSTGLGLYRLGRRAEAEPQLVEALEEYPEGRYELATALCDCDLCPSVVSPKRIKRVIKLCDEILASEDAPAAAKIDAWLNRAEAVLLSDGPEAAGQWAEKSTKPAGLETDARLDLLKSRLTAAKQQNTEAIDQFRELIAESSTPPEVGRSATFHLGEVYERQGDEESAIAAYRSVVEDFDTGDETVVAAVRLGDLLRREPRTLYEDALRVYRRAVRIGIVPENFRNRYTTLEELRERIRDAWEDWLHDGEYQWSIKLATQMAPLYLPTDAAEMAAVATVSLAQHKEQEYRAANASDQKLLLPEVLAEWRRSGAAYARLAQTRISDAGYPDAVWTAAEHYTRGHDFQAALEQTDAFLLTGTESRRPRAMVNYGRLQMDLHRPGDGKLDQAIASFTRMLADYPTSDASFDARFALGECYLEKDEPDLAAEQWQQILDSDVLSPASLVWQQALVALGSLYFHTGEQMAMRARDAAEIGDTEGEQLARQQADYRWALAIRQLRAYLARTSVSAETSAAKFWLAKSLQRSIELPQSQLDAAETNNARLELERQIEAALTSAINEFRGLKDLLEPLATDDRLGIVPQRVLRDSLFEIAHTYFQLKNDDAAIDAYSEAANRYPNDPQVLLAYLQSARCFERLGRSSDARSQIERARIIQEQLSETELDKSLTGFTHDEWKKWLTRTLEFMSDRTLAAGS